MQGLGLRLSFPCWGLVRGVVTLIISFVIPDLTLNYFLSSLPDAYQKHFKCGCMLWPWPNKVWSYSFIKKAQIIILIVQGVTTLNSVIKINHLIYTRKSNASRTHLHCKSYNFAPPPPILFGYVFCLLFNKMKNMWSHLCLSDFVYGINVSAYQVATMC